MLLNSILSELPQILYAEGDKPPLHPAEKEYGGYQGIQLLQKENTKKVISASSC